MADKLFGLCQFDFESDFNALSGDDVAKMDQCRSIYMYEWLCTGFNLSSFLFIKMYAVKQV